MSKETKDISLITAALDMLDSTEVVIENKDVTVPDSLYGEKEESQQQIASQPTFRGIQREQIKTWLLAQLV